MAYSGGIDFISDAAQGLMIPRRADLGFTHHGEALGVNVRQFGENCRMEQKGKGHVVIDGTGEVGCIWFDVADRIEFKHCVVVGVGQQDVKRDAWNTCYFIIIREKSWDHGEIPGSLTMCTLFGEKRYERLGVGMVEAQYVSRDCEAGTLW